MNCFLYLKIFCTSVVFFFFYWRNTFSFDTCKSYGWKNYQGIQKYFDMSTCFTFSLVKLDLVGRTLGPNNKTAFQTQSMIQGKLKELLT